MAERTPGGWHHHAEKAQFEELVWRDGSGRVHFRGQASPAGKRYRERLWPVFWRVRRPRRTTDAWRLRRLPLPLVTYESGRWRGSFASRPPAAGGRMIR